MDSTPRPPRRSSCFIEDYVDDEYESGGVAGSPLDMEEGFSGHHHRQYFVSRPQHYCQHRTRGSLESIPSSSSYSPRSGRFFDPRFEEEQPHFLDSCFLCKRPLGSNRDIFMYRGDIPFCSEECRQEHIEKDEAKDRRWNLSESMKALRKKEQRNSTSSSKTQDCALHTSTIAAA